MDYMIYPHSAYGTNTNTKLAGIGLNPGNMPGSVLSKNYVNIESGLFGINSTNLVKPADPIKPELYTLPSQNLFKKEPVYIPPPLQINLNQRPHFY